MKPDFRLDGVKVATGFGENFLPVPPGIHRVEVAGQAQLDVEVAPGQVIDVYCAPGSTILNKGLLGPSTQERPGLGLFIAIMTVAIVATLVIFAFL
ncbi:hypothetical protein AXK60_24830 [Tsukamurella pseudospumae]|uniref:Uncharacterized protein n=2 Tax=Tsukamurella pseudospumae TaxID=239498 RepID=A0A138AMG2_9ACTN|nr:hypothetical protein AXK60_24830 [Tsukamurella pseudospumae]